MAVTKTFGLDAVWIQPNQRAEAIVAGYTVVDAATVAALRAHRAKQLETRMLVGPA